MGRRRGVAFVIAAVALAAVVPASAQHADRRTLRASHTRCCFEVKANVTFELINTWNNPPHDFTGPTSHGFLVTWVQEGLYSYTESGGKASLHPVGPRPRIAAYLADHDAGAATGTCLRALSTSGDITTWPSHWLAARTQVVQLSPNALVVRAGPPFSGNLAVCGGTFTEDFHSDTPAAKFGMQGPWSYVGRAPARNQLRHGRIFVVNAYTTNRFTQEHGTPPHETIGHSNCILTFRWFAKGDLAKNVRAFNRSYRLTSHGFTTA